MSPGQPRAAKLTLDGGAGGARGRAAAEVPGGGRGRPGRRAPPGRRGRVLRRAGAGLRPADDRPDPHGATWNPSLQTVQSSGLRAQLLAQILVGAGTAAVLGGLVVGGVSLFGAPEGRSAPTVFVVPTWGGGSIACAVSF